MPNQLNVEKITNEQEELKEYYVYELRDPRDDTVFYVGKGKGRRAEHHEKEAIRNDVNGTAKSIRIMEIRARNESLKIVVIGRFDTEAAALAVEATLIHWVYGYDNLTNIQGGHGCDSIRNRGDYSEIGGIDIPKPMRSTDGAYTNQNIAHIEKYGVKEKLLILKESIEHCYPEWTVSDVDMSHPMDPSIWIKFGDQVRVECSLLAKSTNKLIIRIRAIDKTKREDFKLLVEKLGDGTCGVKNFPNNPYCQIRGIEERIEIGNNEEILDRLNRVWQFFGAKSA